MDTKAIYISKMGVRDPLFNPNNGISEWGGVLKYEYKIHKWTSSNTVKVLDGMVIYNNKSMARFRSAIIFVNLFVGTR